MKLVSNRTLRSWLIGALAMVAFLFLFGGYSYYLHEKMNTQADMYNDLSTIAGMKSEQLSTWYRERRQEVTFFSQYQPFAGYSAGALSGRTEESAMLRELLIRLMINQQYENVMIVDRDGNTRFSIIEGSATDTTTFRYVREAFRTNTIHFTDFYFCPDEQKVQIEIIAPLSDAEMGIIGAMVFRIDPAHILFPLIREWPTPSPTAETVIVRQVGDSVWFQNDLRHAQNTALKLKISMARTDVPAVRAVMGEIGLFEGADYSGQNVLADIRRVPETNWHMVVKVDTDEIYADLNKKAVMIFIITTLAILFCAAAVAWYYYSRQRNIYRALHEKSDELVKSQEEFGTTLYSIGDGVITTDLEGRVRHMNPVAERYTGWKEAEACGVDIREVFNIINEDSRLMVENPVLRVLREGTIVGLANHTLLISRSGMETPISDSGAPIRDQNGRLFGTVLVFSDQSATQLRRRIMEIRIRLFEYAIEHTLPEVLTKTLDEIGVITGSPIGFFHFLSEDEQTVQLESWSTHTRTICEMAGLDKFHVVNKAGLWAECIRIRKAVVHNEYEAIEGRKGLPEGHVGLIREVVVPLFRNGKIVAVVGVGNKPIHYSDSDVEIITFLADVCWDIAVHKVKEQRLRESEERFATLFERAPLGYQSLDAGGRFIEVNQAWLEALGYQRGEVIGHWFGDFLAEEFVGPFSERFEKFKCDGRVHTEFEMKTKSGDRRVVAFDGRIGYKNDGSFEKTHCILSDVTERNRLIGELVHAKEKAEESDRLKSAFLANVSHEIRTPMNGILGFLDMLNEPEIDDYQRDIYMEVIHRSGKRLLDTINDIVEISKIESGQLDLHTEEVDISQVMDYQQAFFQNRARERNLLVAVGQQLKGEAAVVMADKLKLEGILTNLLNNAIKFTHVGGVSFGNYLSGMDLVFWVRDTGVGIPEDKFGSIFERFVQVDNSLNSSYEGCGLGLSIVKAYLQKMGGRIWLESEVGKGSTFYFSIPYRGRSLPTPEGERQKAKGESELQSFGPSEGERQKAEGESELQSFGPSEGERQKAEGESDLKTFGPSEGESELQSFGPSEGERQKAEGESDLQSFGPSEGESELQSFSPWTGFKVLVAEDDEIGYLYLRTVLRDRVGQVCRVSNGEDAVRMVREDADISMVLMDIKMPGMDGLDATREIRKFNREIPIIAQTSYAFSGDKEKALDAGCDDYITKPINKADLLQIINKYRSGSLRPNAFGK